MASGQARCPTWDRTRSTWCAISSVRSLPRVSANGVRTDERFNFDDTVSVTLKFDKARIATAVMSYNGGDVDDFRIVGEKGDLYSNPAYQVGSSMET